MPGTRLAAGVSTQTDFPWGEGHSPEAEGARGQVQVPGQHCGPRDVGGSLWGGGHSFPLVFLAWEAQDASIKGSVLGKESDPPLPAL